MKQQQQQQQQDQNMTNPTNKVEQKVNPKPEEQQEKDRDVKPEVHSEAMTKIVNNDKQHIDDGADLDDGNTTLDETYHPLESFRPHQFSVKIKYRKRGLHAFKVGLGVLLTSLLVLIKPLDELFQGNGLWAVITVVIVTLETPGDTTQKMINRTIGTIAGAALALPVGLLGSIFSKIHYPIGHIFVAVSNFLGSVIGTYQSTKGGDWTYAFLLGTVTYAFITLSVFGDGVSIAFFRAAMIIVGGVLGLAISWLPPNVRASHVARAYLADALVDTAVCAELVVHNFLTGRILNPIHCIYHGSEADDTFHKLSKVIQISRVPLEAAISAAKYEAAGKLGTILRESGLAVRLSLRTLLSADALLRQQYVTLDQSNDKSAKLAMALTNVVSSIRSELTKKVLSLHFTTPAGLDACAELTLARALEELKIALNDYVQNQESHTEDTIDVMNRFACHVSFSRLIYDTGRFILVATSTALPHYSDAVLPEETLAASVSFM